MFPATCTVITYIENYIGQTYSLNCCHVSLSLELTLSINFEMHREQIQNIVELQRLDAYKSEEMRSESG